MALEFLYRDAGKPNRVALFPGSWNPPTIAHLAIAKAARQWAGEVVWVLPSAMPHKTYERASFADRKHFIDRIARSHPGFSAAVSSGGLYAEIAGEARQFFGPEVEIGLALGRDAAERIATWDYGAGNAGVFNQLLRDYRLLVAARAGEYASPEEHHHRVIRLPFAAHDDVSSTEIRRRMSSGEAWQDLVPDAIADEVARVYGLDFPI